MSAAPPIYLVDPEDPRAPSQERWEAMAPWERELLLATLPAEVPEEWCMPEGDRHSSAREEAKETLRAYFQDQQGQQGERVERRQVYISGDLNIYYPGERLVAPDVFCVFDVEDRPRSRWVVSAEGKGLDWTLEVRVTSSLKRELIEKSEIYARLGIPEYFVFDRESDRLHGFRLPSRESEAQEGESPEAPRYEPIEPEGGRLPSAVLGLELAVKDHRLRFYAGSAALPNVEERIQALEERAELASGRLDQAMQELIEARRERIRGLKERALAEQQRQVAEQQLLAAEKERLAAEKERLAAEKEKLAAEKEKAELVERVRELEARLEAQLTAQEERS